MVCIIGPNGKCVKGDPPGESQTYGPNTHGSNLEKHLLDKHPDEVKKPAGPQKSTMDDFKHITAKTALEESALRLLASKRLPLSFLDSPKLDDFSKKLRAFPSVDLPSARTMTRRIFPAAVDKIESRVEGNLHAAKAVSVSFDIWPKIFNSFIAVTAYCVNDKFERSSHSLDVVHFNKRHTADAVADKVLGVIGKFIEPDKIVSITHDSASNNTATDFVKKTKWMLKFRCTLHQGSLFSKIPFK